MKLNKKIIIPAMSLLVGTALAGSVSSTIAWYQYSTRANVAYLGTSAGTSGNLKIRIKGQNDWGTRLEIDDVNTYLASQQAADNIVPITSGPMARTDALPAEMYSNPIAGFGPYVKWSKATKANYVSLPLELCYVERDGVLNDQDQDEEFGEEAVYLSDLLIQGDYQNEANEKKSMEDAVRVHIHSYTPGAQGEENVKNFLISKKGGSTVTHGKLDLDGDGNVDQAYTGDQYGFGSNNNLQPIDYGYIDAQHTKQEAFVAGSSTLSDKSYYDPDDAEAKDAKVYPALVAEENGSSKLSQLEYSVPGEVNPISKSIGTTVPTADQGEQKYLNVVITIWIEGWQYLNNGTEQAPDYAPIWNAADFIGSMFDVGLQFAVQVK